jgi:hypothetical protein
MNRKMIVLIVAMFATALMAVPTLAQREFSRTLTEQQINESFRVENPRRARLSNVSVDLQPGQTQVSATYTSRRVSLDVVATMTPYIDGGRIYWTVTDVVTTDGQEASDELLAQINEAIEASWRNYIRGQFDGIVDSIIVTDTDLTITGTTRGEPSGDHVEQGVENGTVNEEDTPHLWRWWQNR